MSNALLEFPPEPPEWRRSGPFFAIAIALHLAVLLYPLAPTIGRLEIPPPATVMVHLVDTAAPPTPMPMQAAPAVAPKPVPNPVRERRAVAPRPVIAMQPEQAVPASNFSVPAVAASAQVATAESGPAMASPAVTPARFEAAYLHNPRPDYPPQSRRLGEEGRVLLRVRVTREGQAAAVDLEKSSNFARLDEAARAVVAHWRFVPAKRGDEAIDATVIVPIVFRLDG